MTDVLQTYIDDLSNSLSSENQRHFLKRVWQTPTSYYQRRLKALRFEGMDHVLDAGSGFGQWSVSLAFLNKTVKGLEYDAQRVEIATRIGQYLGQDNLVFDQGSVEQTAYPDNAFDGIFCYSVLYQTDYRQTVREFYRLLKPGGLLYFCTNGLGWYLHNLLNTHNDAADFSSREMAIETLKNSLSFYAHGQRDKEASIVTPKNVVTKELLGCGYEILDIGAEGDINRHIHDCSSFYPAEKYGQENVWEALCRKTKK